MKQTYMALSRLSSIDDGKMFEILKSVTEDIQRADLNKPPAYATSFIYRKVKAMTGEDPYRVLKKQYNEIALSLYPKLRSRVLNHENPLWIASRLAIAGNIIDFGIYQNIDIEGTVERALRDHIEVDHFQCFSKEIQKHREILYLLDNAGEIVFDLLLIEVLTGMGKAVTAVVKGAPVINDVTMEDARDVGLTDMCRVIDNGSDAVGTLTEFCSSAFVDEFNRHGLIISKGQGNFETLIETDKNNFFLFQAKCDVVAKALKLQTGAMLLKCRYRQGGTD
ncbi:MAG: ARMT1-like domain-containing protein [Nitrospirae bacterium YQR-1]